MIKFILFFISLQVWAQTSSVVLEPSSSRRCKELMIDRNHKVSLKRKIVTLIKRNEDIIKKAPKNKELARGRLSKTLSKLNQELTITKLQISSMEENIVRQGCPGITLSE